jgi:hypothetical protein
MKFSRTISRVKWLSGEKTNVSKTISVLIILSDQYPEDEDRDGLRNVGFFTAQPFDPAHSPRELHHSSAILYHTVTINEVQDYLQRCKIARTACIAHEMLFLWPTFVMGVISYESTLKKMDSTWCDSLFFLAWLRLMYGIGNIK